MEKKIFRTMIALLLTIAVFPFSAVAHAESGIHILLDGAPLATDVPPVILEERTLVPMRAIFEALGYTVAWDEVTQTVTGAKDDTALSLQIGKAELMRNDKVQNLDVAPQIISGRTMVPLRAVAEATGAIVDWDEDTRTVNIHSSQGASSAKPDSIFQGVVMITTNKSQGSGFILDSSGLIVTNCHVVSGASIVAITFADGSVYMDDVDVVGFDVHMDLAVLKINRSGLTALPIGNVAGLKVGDAVVAIGAPEGKQNTATTGKITGLNSIYIVADATVEHGSSGGVLLNASGQVVGIPSFYILIDGEPMYFSQRADFVQSMDLTGSYQYSDLTAADEESIPPKHFTVTQEGNQVHLDWEMLDAEYYLVLQSDTKDGVYHSAINPALDMPFWSWKYPHCFTLTIDGGGTFRRFYKIATVKNGQLSAFSDPIEISAYFDGA